jgi:hypothetical protein
MRWRDKSVQRKPRSGSSRKNRPPRSPTRQNHKIRCCRQIYRRVADKIAFRYGCLGQGILSQGRTLPGPTARDHHAGRLCRFPLCGSETSTARQGRRPDEPALVTTSEQSDRAGPSRRDVQVGRRARPEKLRLLLSQLVVSSSCIVFARDSSTCGLSRPAGKLRLKPGQLSWLRDSAECATKSVRL